MEIRSVREKRIQNMAILMKKNATGKWKYIEQVMNQKEAELWQVLRNLFNLLFINDAVDNSNDWMRVNS